MKSTNVLLNPFGRGLKAPVFYYGIAGFIFVVLHILLPVSSKVYLYFAFLPVVLLISGLWALISLITIWRSRAQGTLLVHAIIIPLLLWLILPKSMEYEGCENQGNKLEASLLPNKLMPTFKTIDDQCIYLTDYQNELKTWPVPVEELDIDTRFGKTHILSFGNPKGKPLILLHWFCSNSLEWKFMAPYLHENFHVYAIDVIGDMGKSIATDPPKSEEDIVQWFSQILDSLRLSKVSICGHSNGGFQAMLIALQSSDKIEKLILLAPAAGFMPFNNTFYFLVFGTALFPNSYYIENFKNMCSVKPNRWSKEMTEMLALCFRVATIQLKVLPRVLTNDELKQFKIPVLLILGHKEFIYSPEESAQRARKLVPNVKVVMLSDCNHAIPFDSPKEASNVIVSFLSEN